MVGSAIYRALSAKGFENIITRTSSELDLRNQTEVNKFFESEKPEYVFLAAAKVGGITANDTYRAEFIYDNLMIETNVIHASYVNHVKKLLFIGSACIYPKFAPQPIHEDSLLTDVLEPSNQPYAIAKIAGIELCNAYRSQYGCNFISAMPTNLYGPNDHYDLQNSHVLPALIRKIHCAKRDGESEAVVWGTGTPTREFLHVDDCANACVFLMENYNEAKHINLGTGSEISIRDLALLIKDVIGFEGQVVQDLSKPDGTPRRKMDTSKMETLGWRPAISLRDGIHSVYETLQNEDWY